MSIVLLSQSVYLTSLPKAVITILLILAWARWAMTVDEDGSYFNVNRRLWNTVQVGAAVLAFGALFLVPIFPLGLIAAVVILGGAAGAYISQHNRVAPAKSRWEVNLDSIQEALMRRRQAKAAKNASLRFGSKAKMPGVPAPGDDNHEAHVMFEELIENALQRNAQRLELVGGDTGFNVQIIVDNHTYRQQPLSPADTIAMLDYLKVQCGMDVDERRKKQYGECKVESQDFGEHELRVMTAGSTRGITCTISIDPRAQLTIEYKDLGLLGPQQEKLKPLIESTGKLVLVATPPEQGRSTTLYSLAGAHDPYVQNIHVFQPMVEREMEGVTMHQAAPEEIAPQLQSLLLRGPSVVVVPSVESAELAKMIAGAANDPDGPRIYAGLKGKDTFAALRVWVKAVGDQQTVAKGLGAIVAQRLFRRLCQVCRQKYQPDADAMRKLNLPTDRIQNLYKASGKVMVKNQLEPCPACNGLGYRGLTGAFEVMVLDDEARQLVAEGKVDALRTHLRRQKMMWLQEAALAKVVSGTTSISEVTQILGKEERAAVA